MLTQDPNKPSAHIEAANKRAATYQANTGILIFLVEVVDGLWYEGLNGGGGGGAPHVGCQLKFHYFVGCRLKVSTFVGCR